jgi:hypothetical protein
MTNSTQLKKLVVLAATIVAAAPVVILSPLVLATPVLVFTPFLARGNGPVSIGHMKTGFARNGGCLKVFPEPNHEFEFRKFSPSTDQLS